MSIGNKMIIKTIYHFIGISNRFTINFNFMLIFIGMTNTSIYFINRLTSFLCITLRNFKYIFIFIIFRMRKYRYNNILKNIVKSQLFNVLFTVINSIWTHCPWPWELVESLPIFEWPPSCLFGVAEATTAARLTE